MASGFAPEFLILVGVDIFLGASILTVLLDRHFPSPLPYILEGASLIGFAELMAGPSFLTSFSQALQFYYSFTYAMISVLTLFATNLYLLFLRKRPFESAVLGICGTIPAGLGILYFTSAFVNGLSLSLPLVPVIPIQGVYAMFGLSIGLVVFSLVVFGRKLRAPSSGEGSEEKEEEAPVINRNAPQGSQVVLVDSPPPVLTPAPQPAKPTVPSAGSNPPAPEGKGRAGPGQGDVPASGPSGHVSLASASSEPRAPEQRARKPAATASVENAGTLLLNEERAEYVKRLKDSIKFFEKAVGRPLSIDPKLLGGTVKEAKKAYLTSAGMLMVEDSKGKLASFSLMDISTEEALQVMREAMKELKGGGYAR